MKVVDYSNKKKIRELIKGKKVVLVGGCFDILHFGHIKFLNAAKKLGNFLVVALESDEFILNRKNKTPFHNLKERSFILSSISYVDLIIKLPLFKKDSDYYDLVSFIKPNTIAVTGNDPYYEDKKKQAEMNNAQIKIVCSDINKFSSTKALTYAPFSRD